VHHVVTREGLSQHPIVEPAVGIGEDRDAGRHRGRRSLAGHACAKTLFEK
jgi:hypothetical protein